jgi:hypothetical protein
VDIPHYPPHQTKATRELTILWLFFSQGNSALLCGYATERLESWNLLTSSRSLIARVRLEQWKSRLRLWTQPRLSCSRSTHRWWFTTTTSDLGDPPEQSGGFSFMGKFVWVCIPFLNKPRVSQLCWGKVGGT